MGVLQIMFSVIMSKESKPIFLISVLFILAIIFLYLPMTSNETSLWVDIAFFAILNVGFLVAAILGVKTKNKSIILFSILMNSAFIMIGMFITFIYLFTILII